MERGTTVLPTRRTSVITDPPNGRLPALTPELEAWMASPEWRHIADVRGGRRPTETWEQLDGGDRCLWYRGVPSFPTAYNNHYQIVQTPDVVAILQEHIHDVRFIPIDGRPHIDAAIRQFAGDSRGRWEGDTLVVETTHFNRHAFIRNFGPNLSQELHVVERFTRLGPDTLGYEFTVTDPKTWTRPWSGSLPMARTEGPGLRVRLPRGQLRAVQHARRLARAGTGGHENALGVCASELGRDPGDCGLLLAYGARTPGATCSTTCEGCSSSCSTRCVAAFSSAPSPKTVAVFGLRSKWGSSTS